MAKDLSKMVEFLNKSLSERIKRGELTIEDRAGSAGLFYCVTIKYQVYNTISYQSFGYRRYVTPDEIDYLEKHKDFRTMYIEGVISDLATKMKDQGYDPSDYLEV